MELVLIIILSLSITKIIVSWVALSMVLFVDALNTLSDAFMAMASYFAIKLLLQRPTQEFPYGYYRSEDFASLLLSILLFGLSGFMIYLGINAILYGYPGTQDVSLAVATATILSVIMFLTYKKVKVTSDKTGMYLLDLSAKDLKVDAFTSAVVVLSILLEVYTHLPFEAIATLIIAIIVLRTAYLGGRASILNLLDAWNKPELIAKIKEIIASTNVLVPGRIRLRQAGKYIFGDAQVFVPEELRLEELDDLIEKVEREIYEAIPALKEITFDIEPLEENIVKCAIPISGGEGRTARVADNFDDAERFLMVVADEKKKIYEISEEIVIPKSKRKDNVVKKCKKLENLGIDCVITKSISDVGFMLLKGYSIDVYITTDENETVDTAMRKYFEDKLIYLSKIPQV